MPLDGEARDTIAELCRIGDLSWLLQEHQLDDYNDFEAWDVTRQTREHLEWVKEIGALYDNMWVDECGRRYGKTVKWLIIDLTMMLRRPDCRGMIATPKQKNIGGIIVPLTKLIFKDLPPEYFPKYVGTKGADHEGLWVEATGSYCKLVGLDTHPDASRGQFLDFCHVTEAAYVKGLGELMRGVVNPQFRYRPWAWAGLETSTAKIKDCDFNVDFRTDATLRGCYRKHTIRDNHSIPEEEIEMEERRCGGKDSATCRRELYCEEIRDEDEMIIPEFDEAVHVVDPAAWPLPKHALSYVGIDPGTTDPLGLCFGYTDWHRGCLVIQAGWQKANASTFEVASRIRATEHTFWGSSHKQPGEPGRDVRLPDAVMTGNGKIWVAPEDALTFWDSTSRSLKPNPYSRVSDISNRFVLDLNTDYGLDVVKADKSPGSAEADILHLRLMFQTRSAAGYPRIVILKNGHTDGLIAQLRSGTWNTDETGHRTDWTRSKALGHCDVLAALKYMARDVRFNRNPFRPSIVDVSTAAMSEIHIPEQIRKQVSAPEKVQAFGGRKGHTFGGQRRGAFGR